MKNVIFLVFFILLLATPLSAGQKITLATGEWAPYTSEKMPGYGFVTEILSAVFKEAKLDVEYKFLPWLRGEQEVKAGEAFATFPYIATSERKKTYDFSDPLANTTFRFFYLKSRIKSEVKWDKFVDLKSYSIGGTLGYWYKKDFDEAGLKVNYTTSDLQGIKMLKAERFELLASEELVGWNLIKANFPQDAVNFAVVKKALKKDELRLMVSRTYPNAAEINKKVNAAIKRIKQKGIYSAILKKYNVAE
jgi:polar amino acid transport system substrate-binding protein